jgi:hypothetical protein
MNKIRIGVWALLFIALTGTSIAKRQAEDSGPRILAYSSKQDSHPSSVLVRSPRGVTYRLSLVPELDVAKHVVVLDLVLQRIDEKISGANLLDSSGNRHGYQPYIFAASDFANGTQKSIYGRTRVIDLNKLEMKVNAKVVSVRVESTTSDKSGRATSYGFQFGDLTLEVTCSEAGSTLLN